jgi:hypothetical protein
VSIWPEEREVELMALADGLLDAAAAARLQALLATDEDAQARLALYRKSRAALDVYGSLAVASAADRERVERARFATAAGRRRTPQTLALAASLVLMVGLLSLLHGRLPGEAPQPLAPSLALALERESAGGVAAVRFANRAATLTPLDTYITPTGTYCRSFLLSDDTRDLAEGFACRVGTARWQGETQALAAAVAPDTTDPDGYAPAAGSAATDPAHRHRNLTRLSSSRTAALLNAGWRDAPSTR